VVAAGGGPSAGRYTARVELGAVGIWGGGPWRVDDQAAEASEVAAELEELGFGAIWVSGGQQPGLSVRFRKLLDGTSRIVVATGILNIWLTGADEIARAVAELEAAHPDRFLLGLGVSHAPLVERGGHTYTRPYSRMRAWLEDLDRSEPTVPADRRVLAALGPKMLTLAAERSAGAHPYFVPVEHTDVARRLLGEGPVLAPEQAVVLEADPERARRIARAHTEGYLAMPNYTGNLRSLGFGDDDLRGGGSDRLVDAVVAWGDDEAVLRRVREHHQAGADHVCVQVLTETPDTFPRAEYRRLAEALRG
jgi:probable F420-dependent oxidoreductase